MPDYASWIARKKVEAAAMGGRPLRDLPGAGREFPILNVFGRRSGEIVNPLTGEVVTGCLTFAKFAAAFSLTTAKLTSRLAQMGYVQYVLHTMDVPMIAAPLLVKPRYYHSPEVTRFGVEEGLVIPMEARWKGTNIAFILITQEGQRRFREAFDGDSPKKVYMRRRQISELLQCGLSQAAISRLTSWPKQTVSRIAKTLKETP